MMLGLKRDLRKEGEGIIYPQEVRFDNLQRYPRLQLMILYRPTVLRRSSAVMDMPSARQ
jgi:hypothetical protein